VHKLKLFNPYIFVTQFRRPEIFPTMNSVRSNNLSLKYHKFTKDNLENLSLRQKLNSFKTFKLMKKLTLGSTFPTKDETLK